jgi:ATPase subunit of ABC transporter with duplicated ATPase domains
VPREEGGRGIVLGGVKGLRLPGSLTSLERVSFRCDRESRLVVEGVDRVVHMGDRIGVVELIWCGKTTLIKLVTDTGVKLASGNVPSEEDVDARLVIVHPGQPNDDFSKSVCTTAR